MTTELLTKAAATASPAKSAAIGQPAQPMGVDIGNGALKLVSSLGEYRLDSYVTYLDQRLSMGQTAGYVEYINGDRTDLHGR